MFWDIFIKLCNEHNTKPNPVAKQLGISSGAVTKWKSGATPNDTTLYKIADYFNVSIEHLKGQEEKYSQDSESLREFVIYHRDGKNIVKRFSPEQIKAIHAFLEAMPGETDEDGNG